MIRFIELCMCVYVCECVLGLRINCIRAVINTEDLMSEILGASVSHVCWIDYLLSD